MRVVPGNVLTDGTGLAKFKRIPTLPLLIFSYVEHQTRHHHRKYIHQDKGLEK